METNEFNENVEVQTEEAEPKKKGSLRIIIILLVIAGLAVFAFLKIGQKLSQPSLSQYGVLINDYFIARVKDDTNHIQELVLPNLTDETKNVELKTGKYTLFLYEVSDLSADRQGSVSSNKKSSLPVKTALFSIDIANPQEKISYLVTAQIVLTNGEPKLEKIHILHKGKRL